LLLLVLMSYFLTFISALSLNFENCPRHFHDKKNCIFCFSNYHGCFVLSKEFSATAMMMTMIMLMMMIIGP